MPLLPRRRPAVVAHRTKGHRATLIGLILGVVAVIGVYSVLFHLMMAREGQHHSWWTGLYWTLQTMSTLGYGDVTFTSDLGRLYSVAVLFTGIMVLFIFLPFTLIQFFYAPWLEARAAARAPSELPEGTSNHVLLTGYGPIESALIERLDQFRTPYFVLVSDVAQALTLHDQGINVMVGRVDDPRTYRRARVEQASLVATTLSDAANMNVALTVREVSATVPLVATATWENSSELLRRAGCQQVIQLGDMLGRSMALRIAGQDGRTHTVAQLDDLLVAEAAAANTPLVGRTLLDLKLRDRFNVNVAGVWERGRYIIGTPEVEVRPDTVLLLSGTKADLEAYDREMQANRTPPQHAIIVGGGSVGRAVSRSLFDLNIGQQIIEQHADHVRDPTHMFIGDAAEAHVLLQAGIDRADSIAITTRDDDVNVQVTLVCRWLRPDVQILSRATHERNVSTLYRAGADVVVSYFPMEANAIFGVLQKGNLLLLAEGLDVFTVGVPAALAGKSIADSQLRQKTGCNVLAVREAGGTARVADPAAPLPSGAQIILIGDQEAAHAFFAAFS